MGRAETTNGFSGNVTRAQLKEPRLTDAREDNLGSHFQGRNKLLTRIMLEVLGELITERIDLLEVSDFLPLDEKDDRSVLGALFGAWERPEAGNAGIPRLFFKQIFNTC